MEKTVAIIPVYNEAERVGDVVRAALRADVLDAVIVVNDGSEDESQAQIMAVTESEPHLDTGFSYLANDTNQGKTEALQKGIRAIKTLGSFSVGTLVFLDADSLPKWSRETSRNMKLWQKAANSLSGMQREPLSAELYEDRRELFISMLAHYICEIAEPVVAGHEIMRAGMYERNVVTDTVLTLAGWAGHAGNRAVSFRLWQNMMDEVKSRNLELHGWEVEGALNAYTKRQGHQPGLTMMTGVVNVGSRIKAGGTIAGLNRMRKIHSEALRGYKKLSQAA